MSALVMGLVWDLQETPEFGRAEKFVLMAYADHADSNGRNIYPSVSLVMKKTFYEERNVQKVTRALEKLGLLVLDGVGPHGTNRFCIPIERLADGGAKITPVQNVGAENAPEGNAPEGNAPEPSVVVKSIKSTTTGADETQNVFTVYQENIGTLTPLIADALKDAEDNYGPIWIVDAIGLAVANNKRNWKYCEAILKRWAVDGKDNGSRKSSVKTARAGPGNKRMSDVDIDKLLGV